MLISENCTSNNNRNNKQCQSISENWSGNNDKNIKHKQQYNDAHKTESNHLTHKSWN